MSKVGNSHFIELLSGRLLFKHTVWPLEHRKGPSESGVCAHVSTAVESVKHSGRAGKDGGHKIRLFPRVINSPFPDVSGLPTPTPMSGETHSQEKTEMPCRLCYTSRKRGRQNGVGRQSGQQPAALCACSELSGSLCSSYLSPHPRTAMGCLKPTGHHS